MIRRRNRIAGQFAARTIAMLESPAYMALSLSARRALDRIEIELAHHGGNDNGRLPVTFDDFAEYRIHRHAIAPALRELEALGFIEITERGRAGNGEWRRPHLFRLTYRYVGNAQPTSEWQRIKTDQEADMIAEAARKEAPKTAKHKTPTKARRKIRTPVPVSPTSQCRKPHHKHHFASDGNRTTSHSAETATTSIISGRNADSAPTSLSRLNPYAVITKDGARMHWITARDTFPEGEAAPKKPWTTPKVEEIPFESLPTELRMMALGLPVLGTLGDSLDARAP
jgi:hypothetical protein